MQKTAVFPGSFDPFTAGHESLVLRGLELFDNIIVAVGVNADKKGFMPLEKRLGLIETVFKHNRRVQVRSYSNLTVDFCKENGVTHILRGLRNAADFEYENNIAQINRLLSGNVETVFLLSLPEHAAVSSSIVRELIRYKKDVKMFLPSGIDFEYFFNS
ncbi:MAG: pantetheine-phosphate adenylyltransferase [Bacteroidales bacterium]|nr:pantetheine-phosphate adenylyltransferase [Bacteroidales bacterium]MBQ5539930.1 pantetheine-phosphate adenylyltransferase [Bacteroidales bacterium]MEE3448044.1 pantetheine-phosphate adenylyltransferase [Bacteroidales bacterium]